MSYQEYNNGAFDFYTTIVIEHNDGCVSIIKEHNPYYDNYWYQETLPDCHDLYIDDWASFCEEGNYLD